MKSSSSRWKRTAAVLLAVMLMCWTTSSRVLGDEPPRFQDQSVDEWIVKLQSDDPDVRQAAELALVEKDAVPVLIGIIKWSESVLQYRLMTPVMRCLAKLGPDAKAAVPVLLAFMGRQDFLHDEVNKTLARIAGDELVRQLTKALKDAISDPTYQKVIRAYAADPAQFSDFQRRLDLGDLSPEFLSAHARAIGVCRAFATISLSKTDLKAVLPLVVEAASWDYANVGASANIVLVRIGDDAVIALLAAQRHHSPLVSENLFRALNQLAESTDVLPVLLVDYQSSDERTRLVAARSLAALGDHFFRRLFYQVGERFLDSVETHMVTLLCRGLADQNVEIRRAAARTLSQFTDYPSRVLTDYDGLALPELLHACKDEDRIVRVYAVLALRGMLYSETAIQDETINALPQRLNDPETEVRAASAKAAERFGDLAQKLIPALLRLRNDPAWETREAAYSALSQLVSVRNPLRKEIVQSLIDELRTETRDPEQYVAIRSVERMRESADAAVPELLRRVESENSYLAMLAMGALPKVVRMDSPHCGQIRDVLLRLSKSDQANVQEMSLRILDQIAVRRPGDWKPLELLEFSSASGAVLKKLDDGSIIVSGPNPAKDT